MKRTIIIIITVLIFAGGFGLFFYPTVSEYFSRINQSAAISNYQKSAGKLSDSEKKEQLELAAAYNDNIRGKPFKDPFSQGSAATGATNYNEILNFDGVMGYVEIPKINVNIPICHGVDEAILQHDIGHIPETAFPIGGAGNHPVLCGHRGLTTSKLFANLDKMKVGDIFYIHVLDDTLAYQVDQIDIVLPDNTEPLKAEAEKDLLTLLTCHPYGINSHRMLVRGTRIPYEEAKTVESETKRPFDFIGWFLEYRMVITILLFAVIFLIVFTIWLIRRKRKKIVKT